MRKLIATGWTMVLVATLIGCGQESPPEAPVEAPSEATPAAPVPDRQVTYTEQREPCAHHDPLRMPLFGDVHVHTSYSFDAAANTTGATPVEAHAFARGEPIPFWPLDETGRPAGSYAIDRPLDFLAVTDHGEFLGERALCRTPGSPSYDVPFCQSSRVSERQGMMLLGQVITTETPARVAAVCGEDGERCRTFARPVWQRVVEAAEAAYDRSEACTFTSFVGYEYTGTPGTSNYHRNVIFRNARVPDLPVSYIDAPLDSLLWARLDAVCGDAQGCEYLTIPHNSNLANGRMAPYMGMAPTLENRRAYAQTRLDREPILEIFQHKGGSECINGLSTVLGEPDELCDVEAVRTLGREEAYTVRVIQGAELTTSSDTLVTEECGDEYGSLGMLGAGCVDETDYLRSGLLVGLAEAQETGLNPVKLGVIAATDTHAATPGAVAESDWRGAVSGEATPAERLQPGVLTSGIDGNPGGLAGVWAVENSRDAIFEAMQRREVFGTSGPRIVPRFFGGWSYDAGLCGADDMVARGYADGVAMGGDLSAAPAPGARPTFVAYAVRDPAAEATPLARLELIKGWIDAEGRMHSRVITLAGDDDGEAGVDLTTGEAFGDGHDTLCAVFTDADFDAGMPAFYYLRAVENPTARWSVLDCLRIEPAERPPVCSDGSYPQIIREMAWTSPIWYEPGG